MMSNMNQMFQGLSSGGGLGGSNWLADYASIKSGSYGKLLKSYYGSMSSSSTTSSGTKTNTSNVLDRILEERRNPKVSKEVQEANANLTSGISTLRTSIATLQNANTYANSQDGQTAADKVASAVKAYVSNYNDVVNSAKKSTLSSQTSHVASMMKSTAANADKLSELGITINSNGTLQLNEGKLKTSNISKVQDLFSSNDSMSYGSMLMSRAQFAGAAETSKTTESKEEDKVTGSSAAALRANSEDLASDKLFEMIKDKDGKETYDIDKILGTAKDFVNNYNKMFTVAGSSNISGVLANLAQIREKTANNADALKNFGITMDDKGVLKIDEDTFKKSDMSQVKKFFKDYGSSIATSASLVDYYLTTRANSASGYTANGTYNVQGNARYSDSV